MLQCSSLVGFAEPLVWWERETNAEGEELGWPRASLLPKKLGQGLGDEQVHPAAEEDPSGVQATA